MRIYLIGFMGSGKSTLGREVASYFQVPFMDTDTRMEEKEGMTIADIFIDKGEYYFRDRETEIIQETLNLEKGIIATGGGLPCYDENMDWILQHGISIYLQWPVEKLKENLLSDQPNRPLLLAESTESVARKIDELLASRVPYYERSAITIEMTGHQQKDLETLIKACTYIW